MCAAACGRISFDVLDDAAGRAPAPLFIQPPTFTATTSVPAPVPGATFTVTPQSGEPWLVLFSAHLSSSSTNRSALEYRVDGIRAGVGGAYVLNGSMGPWQHFYYFDDGRPRAFDVLLSASTGTATVSELAMLAMPLPPASDPHVIIDDPITAWPDGPATELTVTPAKPGRYVILAVAVAEDTTGGDLQLWLTDTDGVRLPATTDMVQGRQYWQSFLVARAVDLSGGSYSVRWNANTLGSGNPTSNVSFTRLLAFRGDAFPAVDVREELSTLTIPAATTATAGSMTLASTSRATVTLQEVSVRTMDTTSARTVELIADGTAENCAHVIDAITQSPTYTRIALVPSSADRLVENRVVAPALPLDVLHSSIVALELP